MSIYPAWRRDNNTVGQILDPSWLVADGTTWDPYYRYSNVLLRGNVGDYPLNANYGYIKNEGYGGTVSQLGKAFYTDVNTAYRISIDNTDYKFGTGSIYYPPGSNGQFIYTYGQYTENNVAPIPFVTDEYTYTFTFEGWFKPNITTKAVLSRRTSGSQSGIGCDLSNVPLSGSTIYTVYRAYPEDAPLNSLYNFVVSTSSIPANSWTHVAWQIEFNPNSINEPIAKIFINGVLDNFGSYASLTQYSSTGGVFNYSSLFSPYVGLADECRFTHKPRYRVSKFLPQKFQYGTTTPTYNTQYNRYIEYGSFDGYYQYNRLLLTMNGTNNSTVFTDASGWLNTVTAVSGAKVTTSEFKYGTGSLDLSAANSRLEINETTAINSELTINKYKPVLSDLICEDFTIEGWVYTDTSNNRLAVSVFPYTGDDEYIAETTAVFRFANYSNTGCPLLGSVTASSTGTIVNGLYARLYASTAQILTIQGSGLAPTATVFTLEFQLSFTNLGTCSGWFFTPVTNNPNEWGVQIEVQASSTGATFQSRIVGIDANGNNSSFSITGVSQEVSKDSLVNIAICRYSDNTIGFYVNGQRCNDPSAVIPVSINATYYTFSPNGPSPLQTSLWMDIDYFRFTHVARYTGASYTVGAGPFSDYSGLSANAFVLKNGSTIRTIIGEYNKVSGSTYLEASDLTVPANQWSHIAWSCLDGILNMYIDGQLAGNYSKQIRNSGLLRMIGGQLHGSNIDNKYSNYIDSLRVTTGEARYFLPSFTPPVFSPMEHPS